MAHFAELNQDNTVIRVVVINNAVLDDNGTESETLGITHCKSLYGQDTTWKQCSYNGNFRWRMACPGLKYDADNDGFYAPKPYDNWVWNDTNKKFQPPVAYPGDDNNMYYWDQDNTQWVLYEE